MPTVFYSVTAKEDLAHLWHYIQEHNPAAADRMAERIHLAAGLLSEHPMLGIARPELGNYLRSFPVKPYLVIYQPLAEGVRVVRIVHAARYLPNAL